MIIKISLMSTGFREADELSKKIATIYDLMSRQLSKQGHYEFGMRSVKSVLRALGRVKRENKDMKEVQVTIKALRDMNLPKFISDDVVLFDNLFMDLFPDQEEPDNDNDELQLAIEEALIQKKLFLNENMIVKIMQLYGTNVVRHGNMLVGRTMSGKTTAW
jgi:dynein heavy chain